MASKKQRERKRGVRRDNRHERRQQQHSGGGEWDCIVIPEGVEVFKPKKGETYHIDVIPYVVGDRNKAADPGDEYFELSYPVYRSLGIDEKKFVAIGEFLGVKDPVAEHLASLRKQGAEREETKAFRPTDRQLMLFFVHEQAEKGLQLFEGAYGTIGELLDEEIKASEEDHVENFDDPDAGATLQIRFKAQQIGQPNPWVRASKINFIEREDGFTADGDTKLAEEILEKAAGICLDELVKVPSYETLRAALEGEPEHTVNGEAAEDDDPEPTPKPGRRKRKAAPEPEPDDDDDDDPEPEPEPEPKPKKGKGKARKPPTAEDLGITKGAEVSHDEYGVCTVLRITNAGTRVTVQDEEGDIHPGIDPIDLEPIPEDDVPFETDPEPDDDPEPEPEPKPKKGKGKGKPEPKPKKGKGKSDVGADEDDWDDGWDDDNE